MDFPVGVVEGQREATGVDDRRFSRARVFAPESEAAHPARTRMLPRGRTVECRLDGSDETDYYAYVPRRVDPSAPLLVSVHGISRDVIGHVELFIDVAERHGAAVVAPYFDAERYAGYQRLAAGKRRADEALDAIVKDVRRRARLKIKPFTLFGYSGGAQFAHRYALTRPRRVRSLILAAAGWYTLPARRVPYPYGGQASETYPHVRCRVRSFLRIPTRVVVGSRDTGVDASVNQDRFVVRREGLDRVERAHRWVAAVQRACQRRDFAPAVALTVLPDVGHSFRQSMENGLDQVVSDAL